MNSTKSLNSAKQWEQLFPLYAGFTMIQEKDPDSKRVENSASHRVALKTAASTSSDYLLEMQNSTESEALEVEQNSVYLWNILM